MGGKKEGENLKRENPEKGYEGAQGTVSQQEKESGTTLARKGRVHSREKNNKQVKGMEKMKRFQSAQ